MYHLNRQNAVIRVTTYGVDTLWILSQSRFGKAVHVDLAQDAEALRL